MARTLRDSFNNEQLSDVTITLQNGGKIFCHKLVLSMGSSVFRGMFQSGMKETTATEVPIEGEPLAVECMLQFLYIGKCDLKHENIAAVTALADYFDIQELHGFCLEYITSFLKVDHGNCLQLLRSGFEQNVDRVFAMAAKYIIERGLWSGVEDLTYPLMESLVNQAKEYHGSHQNVVGVINRWMYQLYPLRRAHGIALLTMVDLRTLSFPELAEFCSMAIVQNTPELQFAVVKAMSCKSSKVSIAPTPAKASSRGGRGRGRRYFGH